jgi:hypothetical protein
VKVAVWATAVAMPVGTVEVVTSAVLVGTLEVGILTMLARLTDAPDEIAEKLK